uniref:VWFA domain-containing protein n=1 Tax=Romanomermis culicivorax TaxID=13658 RepID=A0A915J0L7_ROMCU
MHCSTNETPIVFDALNVLFLIDGSNKVESSTIRRMLNLTESIAENLHHELKNLTGSLRVGAVQYGHGYTYSSTVFDPYVSGVFHQQLSAFGAMVTSLRKAGSRRAGKAIEYATDVLSETTQ